MAGLRRGRRTRSIRAKPRARTSTTCRPRKTRRIPTVCSSLEQALEYLDKGRAFLTKGGVFTDSYIDAYIDLKMQEVTRFRMTTHPVEFDMYYSL